MSRGFDCAQDVSAHGQQIKDAEFGFVCRYLCSDHHNPKILTRSEALHLSGMGIFLVSVFENAGDHAGYFNFRQGIADANDAAAYAKNVIHQPQISPIYFAVDFDATEQEFNQHIVPYFKGIQVVSGAYPAGDYGSGYVCRRLKELGLVSHTWLAQSPGWAEYHAYRDSNEWSLLQGMAIKFHALDVDPDESQGNGGGWRIS